MHHPRPAAFSMVRKHARFGAVLFLAVAGAALAATPVLPTITNGGARMWLAFDPEGRTIGQVQFLQKIVTVVNTSNAANTYTIYYEPQHITVCAGTLAAGGTSLCGVQPTQHLSGGYFQVIAAQPVLMGGHSDMPVIRYAQQSPNGPFGADPSTGMIQNIPFVWQQGCPPRPGSGCPNGNVVGGGGGVVGGTTVKPKP